MRYAQKAAYLLPRVVITLPRGGVGFALDIVYWICLGKLVKNFLAF